jgi:hypothetical protein
MKQFEKMISIYPGYTEKRSKDGSLFFDIINDLTGIRALPFSSARAAMVYGLRSLGIGRMDEILVPLWLGHCILSALSRTAFPTMTPSNRTKAILVYHQFGYPQKMESIEKAAMRNGWIILNDCANTIFSHYRGANIIKHGDFSVLSFSKLYPCILGGALISSRSEIQEAIEANYNSLIAGHEERSNLAYDILKKAKGDIWGSEEQFEIEAVFGYLPEIVTFPPGSFQSLPNTALEIEDDTNRRRHLLDIIGSYFPERIPECPDCDIVPFAVPVLAERDQLEQIPLKIKSVLNVEVPVLHFDFSRNMLKPDYRKSLVIGCHKDWTEDTVIRICELIWQGVA